MKRKFNSFANEVIKRFLNRPQSQLSIVQGYPKFLLVPAIFLLILSILMLSSVRVDAAPECYAQGIYSTCASSGGFSSFNMCQDQILQGMGVASTQEAAAQKAIANCTQHMTNMTISSMGNAHIKSSCRVTRCNAATQPSTPSTPRPPISREALLEPTRPIRAERCCDSDETKDIQGIWAIDINATLELASSMGALPRDLQLMREAYDGAHLHVMDGKIVFSKGESGMIDVSYKRISSGNGCHILNLSREGKEYLRQYCTRNGFLGEEYLSPRGGKIIYRRAQ